MKAGDLHTLKERRYEAYHELVGEDKVLVMPSFSDFNSNAKQIALKFLDWNKKNKVGRSERETYINFFSSKKWNELTCSERKLHRVTKVHFKIVGSDCNFAHNSLLRTRVLIILIAFES